MAVILILLYFIQVVNIDSLEIDKVNCGIDEDPNVHQGIIDDVKKYPWMGIFYYLDELNDRRAVTPVVLIQNEFVLANAADIGPIPKKNFRANSRVLLGEHWIAEGRRVRNYVLHPEYGQTYNTLALIQLRDGVDRYPRIRISPICPAPRALKMPTLYVVKMSEDYEHLHKEVFRMIHIPARMCKDFYIAANLYSKKMRPPFVICAISLESERLCLWNAGAALVMRDVWGRWQLLGLGVRGPGCNGPARFLDMHNYYPWIRRSLDQFRRITISKIHDMKYILRSSSFWEPETRRAGPGPVQSIGQRDDVNFATQRFGNCDEEEKKNLLYRDFAIFRTDTTSYTFATYNMTVQASIEISCMTLEVMNGSAVSEMTVRHFCTRTPNGGPCYAYKGSLFDVSVVLMFTDISVLEVNVWGWEKQMKTLDIMEWKWEEGSYYSDFAATRDEYTAGSSGGADFGFEPLDEFMWVPDYDLWTTSSSTESVETESVPALYEKATTDKHRTRTSSMRPPGTRWPTRPTTPTSTSTTTTPKRNRTTPTTINSRVTFPQEKFSQLKQKCHHYDAKYETFDARMETMKTLVYDGSFRELADAGYYYTGKGESIRCMCCGMMVYRLNKTMIYTSIHAFVTWRSCEFITILVETRSRQRIANLG